MADTTAKKLEAACGIGPKKPVIGVFAPCDPRIDNDSRVRTQNIVKHVADSVSGKIMLPGNEAVDVVYSDILIDSEKQADIVAAMFREAGVDILIACPDTWAFPQLTGISFLQQFPDDTPINITCGNSGPKPGVVYAHALNGAFAQYGRMTTLNVGNWPDTGLNPEMSEKTLNDLIDWCYAAVTKVATKGRRVVIFGHDSMGMETALAHIIPTRNTFGLEVTRLDMKLLSDMLAKESYDKEELKKLRAWVDTNIGDRLEVRNEEESKRFDQSLALYLICRDILADLNAIGGGFMSQLEWGSDPRGLPLPVADVMETLFNSTFDHNGPKKAIPFATEADCQALLTMLYMSYLTGGGAPLFMDFRKVWEGWEIKRLADEIGVELPTDQEWAAKGLVDGNNSGSASLDWAGMPDWSAEKILERVSMPIADDGYFPGGGNSVTFMSPAGIKGIAARMAYCSLNNKFSMIWDEAESVEVPAKLSEAMTNLTNWNWPHTFLVPKYATMTEYKQYTPANHFHMVRDLPVARLQYWMDLTGVQNVAPWAARPSFIEGVDRPEPLVHLLAGGAANYKSLV
ncbi:MAG: hypothetical protein ACIAQZ_13785 [Sedimentisphaeraceae bacterium JB056]